MNEFITENKLIASCLLIAIAIVIRWLAVRHLQKLSPDENDLPRRWANVARNAVTTLVVIGLILIWLSELRFVALSIATFTVALIIATREFIQCFIGALYQAITRAFAIGDWIKIGDSYGEVVSRDWLTTRLLEIDIKSMGYGYTGRTLIIPNNQFITHPIENLNFMSRYVAHSFSIVRDAEPINVFQVKALILEKARNYSAAHEDVAQRYNAMLEKSLGVRLPGPESSVIVTTTNLGKNQFTITVFCPTEEAVKIEQQLTEDFMTFWYAEVERLKIEKEEKRALKDSIDDT